MDHILPCFVHLFNRYATYVPGAVQGIRVMSEKFKAALAFIWLIFHWSLEKKGRKN